MAKVNFIKNGGDMFGLRASTAIINSGIFSSAPVSLIQVGTDNLTLPPLLHLPYTGHRRRPGTLRCPVNVPVE